MASSTTRRDEYQNPPLEDDDMIDPDDGEWVTNILICGRNFRTPRTLTLLFFLAADLNDFDDPLQPSSSRAPLVSGNISSSSQSQSQQASQQDYLSSRIGGEDRRAPTSTIDESVWDTLRRDLLAVWSKMREVLWPRYLLGGTMFESAEGLRGVYANLRGAGLSGGREELAGLAGRVLDTEALLNQNNMTPGLRDWDLWGPLVFCLLLSMLLSFNAGADQKEVVFSGVFAMVWIGEAVVTMQIKLLGGNMYVFRFSFGWGGDLLTFFISLVPSPKAYASSATRSSPSSSRPFYRRSTSPRSHAFPST